MYPYLFGIEVVRLYDIIGILGYGLLIGYFIVNRQRLYFIAQPPQWWRIALLIAVQVVAYTFAGENLAPLVGRGTEFFAFITVSAVGMVLTAAVLGCRPLRWLDATVPLYLSMASLLKLSCFSGGCCGGLPWQWGLYNVSTSRTEFPIQLAEAAAYALFLWLFWGYRRREGQRFALFLAAYAAVRFTVQFFRADVAVFTPFHWMSAVFAAIGGVMWLLCRFLIKEKRST